MTVGIFEAKQKLSELVERASQGEEIVITRHGRPVARLVPNAGRIDQSQARVAAERVREGLEVQGRADPKIAITVSAGVAAWRPGRSSEQVFEAADAMLYAAKRAGKDRVLAETGLVTAGDGEGAA